MTRAAADGWFEAEAPCGAGTPIAIGWPIGLAVPDPASRAQADDVHDPEPGRRSARLSLAPSGWRGRPWHETVLYELHAGSLGGFAGVQARAERLAELGITAIELMPLNDFPGKRNWGYDGVLPFAPDRAYGTPDDLKALVDAAHGHGLMVFLDVVYNHFGPRETISPLCAAVLPRRCHTPWGAGDRFPPAEVRASSPRTRSTG
jgi:maltooligosyltrehalose trehalohydrolase